MPELARLLKTARRKKKHGQLLAAAKLGVSQQQVSNYEAGSTFPAEDRWPVVAAYLGISLDEMQRLSADAQAEREALNDPNAGRDAELSRIASVVAEHSDQLARIAERVETVLRVLGGPPASPAPRSRRSTGRSSK